MRVVFVGGGTGGHFYPLIAVAEAVRERDRASNEESDLIYIGPEPYNQAALDSVGLRFVSCPAGKRRLYRSILNWLDSFKIISGFFVAFFKLLWLYPDVIMSKGGYTSVPVILAAWLLRIPIMIHESDAVAGRANKLAARFSRYVAIAFPEVSEQFPKEKIALVGMPIRRAFFKTSKEPFGLLGIPTDRPVILVTGGSSGAVRINDFILRSLTRLLPKYTVIHQVGDQNVDRVTADASALFQDRSILDHYFVFGHLEQEQFVAALECSSLVLTRAGSTTLFEIALKGRPSIVIPIPEDVSRDQRTNAYTYARATGASVLEEHNLSDDLLVAEIDRILSDEAALSEMRSKAATFTTPKAADTLAGTLRSIANEHES
ncbi:hypothetical protein A2392_00850 [Candidatus Kaiserbacteria bacterium RIFOXYB1_FULL_46_14]|uniref:UDP-N-acetylglucosamine--N-acetylmuramyl-(pentapeptide) pyrophosphoryl-undecaprenol N-acetylglucosamine transferase n=1 Tax=Candidatus Kaiserbacteria bacterium RIFOXYB1_FULL_46_14 TaxID=1798531 RepID=A0A1F6FJG3_9BACT|nr:MAG: hypothetical protein A2392_00850 [Candidatus Kaiserbacteria bacterium RIFOXYB1_FULL_46_14]